MNALDVINSLSLVVIAGSFVAIAIQARAVTASFTKLVAVLVRYFSMLVIHDPHGHHHTAASKRDLVVWEWRGERWVLRPESGTVELAGPPPNRPGTYDAECVTTRRPAVRSC